MYPEEQRHARPLGYDPDRSATDGGRSPLGPVAVRPEPDGVAGENERRDHATIAAGILDENVLDPHAVTLPVGPRSPTASLTPRGFSVGATAGQIINDLSGNDPPSGLTVAMPGGHDGATYPARPVPIIPGYEILGELGRGGMGVVYLARQILLNRVCVLKMMLGGVHESDEAGARFLAEAEAIARLQHLNIVQIHHIGATDGLPYIELEYIPDGSLDHRLDGIPWPARRAAMLIEALAQGIAEAHRVGIVHRDLKPGNILLATDGTPKVSDFGLAKSQAIDSGLTRSNSITGSPGYMSPEQAEGRADEVGPPADIYALGAIFYELLTGRPPFRGPTILATLEQTRTAEPVPPSRLVPHLPRDAETIALKCLHKQTGKRYSSAVALSADLRRFLGGEPIVGRSISNWERAWRWCRRHPAPAALTAAVVLVSITGMAGILWQWREAVEAWDLASKRAVAETEARRELETILVDMYTASGIAAGDEGEHARAALWFANAARLSVADPDRRRSNAIRVRTWGRLAVTPLRAVLADGSWPGGLLVHPDGRHLITRSVIDGTTGDGLHSLWDLEAERSIPWPGGLKAVSAAAWSPDGAALAIGDPEGDVIVARFPGGVVETRLRSPGSIRLLTYSGDGTYLAIASGNLARVWDLRAHAFVTPEFRHPSAVTTLAFQQEGRFLATGCLDNLARVFAVPNEDDGTIWPPVPHIQSVSEGFWQLTFCSPPVFVDGGRGLVTYGGDEGLSWHSLESGEETRTLDSPEISGRIAAMDLSPNGRHLAVLSVQIPATVRFIEIATGRPVGLVMDHATTIFDAAFSPDGRTLLTGSTDNTVRLWSVPGGEPLSRPIDLHRPVRLVAFAPHGRSLLTQDGDLVRLWALPEEALPTSRVPLEGMSSSAAISPDGTLTIPTGMTYLTDRGLRSTRAYRVSTGRPAGPSLRAEGLVIDAAFSPDGRSVATLNLPSMEEAPAVIVWDWASGRHAWRAALPSEPRSLAYRPDGRRLAVLCGDGELLVFGSEAGRIIKSWQAHDAEPAHHWINNGEVSFSPDGRSVLSWGMGNELRVWDADAGRQRYPPLSHREKCHDVQFSPDGLSMALASYDGSVRVRDVATGTAIAELPAHPDIVYSASFSPDHDLLVTACRDRTVRVWDWRAGRLVCPPFVHASDAVDAIFTPDGHWVISVSNDGTTRVWDWRTGNPVTPSLAMEGKPMSVAVTPAGTHAVVGGFLDDLLVFDLRDLAMDDDEVDPDALCIQAELLAGMRLHEGGGMVNLSPGEWLDRWRTFRRNFSAIGIAEPRVNSRSDPSSGPSNPESNVESLTKVRRETQ